MSDWSTIDESYSVEVMLTLERACDAFEAAWQSGQRPSIEEVLHGVPEVGRRRLLYDLLALEIDYRRRLGERPAPGEYLQRFAELHEGRLADLLSWPEVPGYELLEELGRGAIGIVYKARQLDPSRWVAIKMLRDGAFASSAQRQRFVEVEVKAAARLRHPNLVPIYEARSHDRTPWFSMEYAAGGSLDKYLESTGRSLPPRAAAELVHTLAGAVHYLHENQIIHRDLKPGNILLAGDGRPMITDFGLAKLLDAQIDLTQSEAILGTAGFMAPEQAAGAAKHAGAPADIYALGAILYSALTARPPFCEESYAATIAKVLAEEPVRPTALCPEIPGDLETVCLKCLEKDPARRYDSARALASDLERFLAGEPVTAAAISELDRLIRWAAKADFTVEEILTYGVRDIVCTAVNRYLQQTMVLQVITAAALAEPAEIERFQREAKAIAHLDHPNIVGVRFAGELHGRHYLALEYVEGGSLIERFGDSPAPPRTAVEIVVQLARAMQYAHEHGVLHCALKPSNVLLTPNGVPMITNFGRRHVVHQRDDQQSLPLRRLPTYTAPEILNGQAADVRADVYSLGAILYRLLIGEPPFLANTLAETWEQVRVQTPPALSSRLPGVLPQLDAVCRKCLQKEPESRYASAREFAEALESLLSPSPTAWGFSTNC